MRKSSFLRRPLCCDSYKEGRRLSKQKSTAASAGRQQIYIRGSLVPLPVDGVRQSYFLDGRTIIGGGAEHTIFTGIFTVNIYYTIFLI